MQHLSADGYPITLGARFWDNDLKVLAITGVADHSNDYADTGCVQTWHRTTRGISDTMSGHMQKYGRMARFFRGKDAEDYDPGTNYADIEERA